jgi:signal peptidase I
MTDPVPSPGYIHDLVRAHAAGYSAWLAEREPDDNAPPPPKSLGRHVLEWALVLLAGFAIFAGVRTFFFQAFSIPSTSMVPTLAVGDRVLVNKLSYQFRQPVRGEIVVFDRPEDSCDDEIADLIKRVIGLAGESVTFDRGSVFIDSRRVNEPYLPEATATSGQGLPFPCPPDNPCVVPPGHLWVMGDSRAASCDSRFFGPIPEDSVAGRAFVRMWPPSRIGGL